MDDQKNFITAMILIGLVWLGYWFYYGKPLAEQARKDAAAEIIAAEAIIENPVIPTLSREVALSASQRISIDTPSLSGSFDLRGTRFDDLRLKNYNQTLEADSGPVILLTPEGSDKSSYIFDNWVTPDGGSGITTDWQLVGGTTLTPTTPIILQFDGEDFSVRREVSVDDKYLITLTDQVSNTSARELSLIRKGAARQHDLPDDLTNFFILQEGPIAVVDKKLVDMKYSKIRKERDVSERGESGWAGLTDKYWLTAAIAPQDKVMTMQFGFRNLNDRDVYEAAYSLAPVTLSPGATINSVGHIYAGAKERKVLEGYRDDIGISRMDLAIDWGLLGIITRPMSWALSFLGISLGNFGLGIMALTLGIKIVLFPLFNKQYEGQAKMKKLQPKMKKLQDRYKDDRAKLQQEVMAMYRKEGANPVAGCLPIIPTIFIFFALYKSVFINIDMRHKPFFGYIQDLSAKDPLSILNGFGLLPWDAVPIGFLSFFAIGPLALLYGATMALMQTLTPMGGDPMQKKIFAFMPWVFMFILAPFATGLLVYWVWNNVLSFIQQYIITRKFKVDTPIDVFFRKITGKEKAAAGKSDSP